MQNSFSTKYRMYAKYRDPTTDTMEDVMRIRAATALAVIPATRETKLLTPPRTEHNWILTQPLSNSYTKFWFKSQAECLEGSISGSVWQPCDKDGV